MFLEGVRVPVGLSLLKGSELTIQLGLRNVTISHHEDWKHQCETFSTLRLRYMEFCLGFEPRISWSIWSTRYFPQVRGYKQVYSKLQFIWVIWTPPLLLWVCNKRQDLTNNGLRIIPTSNHISQDYLLIYKILDLHTGCNPKRELYKTQFSIVYHWVSRRSQSRLLLSSIHLVPIMVISYQYQIHWVLSQLFTLVFDLFSN